METAAQSYSYVEGFIAETAPDAASTVVARSDNVHVQVARQPIAKRLLDVVFGSIALVLLAPSLAILLLAVAVDTKAWPIFVQVRTGRGGRQFRMFKLRTMAADAESRLAELRHLNEVQWPMFKIRNDPRVTSLGRFLRAASMDELPQLVNVIKGDMSLVGPRPPLPHEVATYTAEQAKRLSVLPGLTGLWQVSGRADCSFEQAVALDLHYIANQHLRTDLAIILQTFGAVVRRRGAY